MRTIIDWNTVLLRQNSIGRFFNFVNQNLKSPDMPSQCPIKTEYAENLCPNTTMDECPSVGWLPNAKSFANAFRNCTITGEYIESSWTVGNRFDNVDNMFADVKIDGDLHDRIEFFGSGFNNTTITASNMFRNAWIARNQTFRTDYEVRFNNIGNMSYMFANAKTLPEKTPMHIDMVMSSDSMYSVVDANHAFENINVIDHHCRFFGHNIKYCDSTFKNTDIGNIFFDFNESIDVLTMANMANGCTATHISVPNSAINASHAFYNCGNGNPLQIYENMFFPSNVVDASYMYANCNLTNSFKNTACIIIPDSTRNISGLFSNSYQDYQNDHHFPYIEIGAWTTNISHLMDTETRDHMLYVSDVSDWREGGLYIPNSVIDMSYAFRNVCMWAHEGDRVLNYGNNVVNMSHAFEYMGSVYVRDAGRFIPTCGPAVVDMSYGYASSPGITGRAACGDNVINMSHAYDNALCINNTSCGNNVIDMSFAFNNCQNLRENSAVCGNNVTNMCSAFSECINMTGSPVCGNAVIDFSDTFYNCRNLTGTPVCGNNVVNMSGTYTNCINITGSPICGPNVKNMASAYCSCYKLTGTPVCGNNVTDFSDAYSGCINITGSPVCGNNVIDMSYSYSGCNNLSGSPVCGNNVTNMYCTYYACYGLDGSPACGKHVTDMNSTYRSCDNLTGSPVCGNNVTNMEYTYFGCWNLTGAPVCGNNVTDMMMTYFECCNLTGEPVCGPKVDNMYWTYVNCRKLTGSPVCGENVTEFKRAYSGCYNLNGSPVCGDKVHNLFETYSECYNLTGSPVCGNNVEDMESAYRNCANLTGSPVCGPNVSTMTRAYENCSNLTGTAITGNADWADNAYRNCRNITSAIINAEYIPDICNECVNLKTVTLGRKCSTMDGAFNGCTNLKYIKLYFNFGNVSDLYGAFVNTNISQINAYYDSTMGDPTMYRENLNWTLKMSDYFTLVDPHDVNVDVHGMTHANYTLQVYDNIGGTHTAYVNFHE